MDILSQLNSPAMYLICGGIIFFVALVCVFFMVRAYRAGVAIGMDKTKMKRTITASATFAALPSVGILLGVIALSGSLGTPWSWLRLSVIGALHYETQVAEAAAEAVGLPGLSASAMTPQAFTTIALLMGVCIMWGMVFSIFFNKKYLLRLKAPKKNGAAGGGFGKPRLRGLIVIGEEAADLCDAGELHAIHGVNVLFGVKMDAHLLSSSSGISENQSSPQ